MKKQPPKTTDKNLQQQERTPEQIQNDQDVMNKTYETQPLNSMTIKTEEAKIVDWKDSYKGKLWSTAVQKCFEAPFVEVAIQHLLMKIDEKHQTEMADARTSILSECEKVWPWLVHDSQCILQQSERGEPTEDGGYRTMYAGVWYKRGEEPECDCGLSETLQAISSLKV